MKLKRTGIVATSRKENEWRVPIHPHHLETIPRELRSSLVFERGYGRRFNVDDSSLRDLGFESGERTEILASSDVVLLPKPLPEDLQEMREGATHWGWPHCVQQRDITQVAIDRRLTLLAFEAMYHWGSSGERQLHTFYKNNELAGYCSVLHALELAGWDGFYGPPRRVLVLGFGSVSRGAIYSLQGRGFADIIVLTQRPPPLVRDQIVGCRYGQMRRATESGGAMTAVVERGGVRTLLDELATAALIVNGTLQDSDNPLMFLRPSEEERLAEGCLIVDVSCDEGMGFPFARPTSFEEPIFRVGARDQVIYYGVDHSPSYLWDSASWEISQALLPYLETVVSGPDAWADEPTLKRAVEIRQGVISNPKILSLQGRSADYPHRLTGS